MSVEFEQWAEETLTKVRRERSEGAIKVVTEAIEPLQDDKFRLRTMVTDLYHQVHEAERALIVVEDRLAFCNRVIRTGEVPVGVDIGLWNSYSKNNESTPTGTDQQKEASDERHQSDDGSGVRGKRPASTPGSTGSARAVPRRPRSAGAR